MFSGSGKIIRSSVEGSKERIIGTISVLLSSVFLFAFHAPVGAAQPPTKVRMIGFLDAQPAARGAERRNVFSQGLSEWGYKRGENIKIEYRSAEGYNERLPRLASELVELKVDLIFTVGGTPAALAAKRATTLIPIIFLGGIDPIAARLVASLARPEANITRLTIGAPGLSVKD